MTRNYFRRAGWRGGALMLLLLAGMGSGSRALAAEVAFHGGVGGELKSLAAGEDDSLLEIARAHDLGYNEITSANPGVDPFVPDPGTKITLPTRWILPETPAEQGIVVNLADMRLYLFPGHRGKSVTTFPIGIGDEGWDTPLGTYSIIEKIEKPAWHVPASIRAQKPELPAVVPPGPDNPLGSHALRLSIGTVLIHGTDRPYGIGMRVSHGCMHLYPEDITALFRRVPVGTRVTIVDQPVKVAFSGGRVLVEVHEDVRQAPGRDLEREVRSLLEKKGVTAMVDQEKLKQALAARSGVVTDVTR
ncbi:L,D-transpeptidase family protein [Geomonas sp. Red32]|uniref:L,D-transpeptidase family protein n=1 Tax=Geomonas sp. Red32 TaxID=2912856 RepID=UPI00202D0504|nr:L,D-transpeptidase family protein [Geomonas sp. Red32]MCM0082604.1 L,D-transpeptidase family protein [Geomonas sp. Red32]